MKNPKRYIGLLLVTLLLAGCATSHIPEGYDVSHEIRLAEVSGYLDVLRDAYLLARAQDLITRDQFIQAIRIDTDVTKSWNAYLELVRAGTDTPEGLQRVMLLIDTWANTLARWGLDVPERGGTL